MQETQAVRDAALVECILIARAIETLGGSATALRLATYLKMDRRKVQRRLQGAGPSIVTQAIRHFACVKRLKEPSLWRLTTSGVELIR